MNFFRWLQQHVRLVLLVVGGLCALGGFIAANLPVAIFPDLKIPRIIMAAEGGDAPAENILVSVTKPIEDAVSTVPGLRLVQSQTTRGSAGFTLTFEDGTDMDTTLQLVQSRVAEIRSSFPAGVTFTAEKLNPTVFPILDYSITSNSLNLVQLRQIANYTIKPRIARVPGVARVLVNGGDVPEFIVTIRPGQLASHGLAMSQVEDAITKANAVNAVGNYTNSYVQRLVLVSGMLTGVDSIKAVVVAVKNRVPIRVGDIADVSEGIQRRTVIATGGGKQAVLLNVVRQPQGNTVQVADDVSKELQQLQPELPKGISINSFYDQSQIVRESQTSVIEAIAVGGVLALIVVALFLRNARSAFVALIMLPITLLITFAGLRLLGMSLNIMTLGAIAIALGLVIDDAIVVVEHIFVQLEEGRSRTEAVANGLREILPAMFASSAASIVTFLPLMLLPGVTGDFFAPLALTLVMMLLISLALALTVVPIMANWLFPKFIASNGPVPSQVRRAQQTSEPHPAGDRQNGVRISRPERIYRHLVRSALRHPGITLLGLVPVAIVAYFLFGQLQTGFMPEFDEGAFVFDYKMPAGTSLEETDRVMNQVENVLAHTDGVETWSRLTGAQSGSGLEITTANQGDLLVRLKSGKRPSMDDVIDDVRTHALTAVPNMDVDIKPILGDLIGDLAGAPSPIEVKVFGPDVNQLTELAHEIGKAVSSLKGVVDMEDGVTESGPEVNVVVDPVRASELGLSTDTITAAAEGAMTGDLVSSVRRGDILEGIRVRYPFVREGTEKLLSQLQIANANGQLVPLGSVAAIQESPGTPELDRENQRLMFSVTARLEGVDLGTGIREVQAKLSKISLPPGYSIEYGGLYKSQQESFSALKLVLAVAGILVFAVLVLTFRSFRIALSLLLAAVLSLFGVVLALYLTNTPLNISSYTGAIMIVGIVTENGVLLFDEFRRRRSANPNAPVSAAMLEAGLARLRPILMTTCAAILTLFPLALGIGAGAAMQKPLAVAVIGGLTLSMLFTLIVAPALFAFLSKFKRAS